MAAPTWELSCCQTICCCPTIQKIGCADFMYLRCCPCMAMGDLATFVDKSQTIYCGLTCCSCAPCAICDLGPAIAKKKGFEDKNTCLKAFCCTECYLNQAYVEMQMMKKSSPTGAPVEMLGAPEQAQM